MYMQAQLVIPRSTEQSRYYIPTHILKQWFPIHYQSETASLISSLSAPGQSNNNTRKQASLISYKYVHIFV